MQGQQLLLCFLHVHEQGSSSVCIVNRVVCYNSCSKFIGYRNGGHASDKQDTAIKDYFILRLPS